MCPSSKLILYLADPLFLPAGLGDYQFLMPNREMPCFSGSLKQKTLLMTITSSVGPRFALSLSSLTAAIVWFNGGPGCSSMIGLTTGNGPITFEGNTTRMINNPYSWTKFGHVLYIDQPVGTGYSTVSETGPTIDNDVVTTYLYDWLKSFFAHFPHLQTKQLYLAGESWGGVYVPHLASAIIDNQDSFPLNLQSMIAGDGAIGNGAALATVSIPKYVESQNSIIGMPDDILAIFAEASETCGFDDILEQVQYPPEGKISIPADPEGINLKHRRDLGDVYNGTYNIHPTTPEEVREAIFSSAYGSCATFTTAMDYLNTRAGYGCGFNVYDISDDCDDINYFNLVGEYFNQSDVQASLNVPNSSSQASPYFYCDQTGLNALYKTPAPAPAYFLFPDLVTSHNISLHIYWGENDMLLNHIGAELVLQNMTWNGEQGFSSPIDRPFYADNAAPSLVKNSNSNKNNPPGTCATPHASADVEAGKWISERGVTYHLFHGAGHSVFLKKPREMFAYMRDVVFSTTAPTKH
ncbi:Alpha/Beta hydrolase protein [Aspergillus unguis]